MQRRAMLGGLLAVPAVLFGEQLAWARARSSTSKKSTTREKARARYKDALAELDETRKTLAVERHDGAASIKDIRKRARLAILSTLRSTVLEAWAGTEWDFYGTTQTPGEGQIACGYFVTTVLKHLGFRVQRAKLAQQASENIVKTLCNESAIWRFRKGNEDDVIARIIEEGAGLYVVGLDNHVGFLDLGKASGTVELCHASYVDPAVVCREPATRSAAFSSRYHVVGKLLSAPMIDRWLAGEAFETHVGSVP